MKKKFFLRITICLLVFFISLSILIFSSLIHKQENNTLSTGFSVHREFLKPIKEETGISAFNIVITTDVYGYKPIVYNMQNTSFNDSSLTDGYIYSLPYIYDDIVLVSKIVDSFEFSNFNGSNYVDYHAAMFFRNYFASNNIVLNEISDRTLNEALKIVLSGNDLCLVGPKLFIESAITELGINEELYISRPLFEVEYRISLLATEYEQLANVNKVILKLNTSRWYDNNCTKYGMRKRNIKKSFFSEKSNVLVLYITSFLILFILVLCLTFFVIRYNNKRKQLVLMQKKDYEYRTSLESIIQNKKAAETELEKYSLYDSTTGFYNYEAFISKVIEKKNKFDRLEISMGGVLVFSPENSQNLEKRFFSLFAAEIETFINRNNLQDETFFGFDGINTFYVYLQHQNKQTIDHLLQSAVFEVNGKKFRYKSIEFSKESEIEFLTKLNYL